MKRVFRPLASRLRWLRQGIVYRSRLTAWRIFRVVLVSTAGIVAGLLLAVLLSFALNSCHASVHHYRRSTIKRDIKTGPNGGRYYVTESGRKVYLPRKKKEIIYNEGN